MTSLAAPPVPALTMHEKVTIASRNYRIYFKGTTNSNGTARINYTLSDGTRYHFAIAIAAFENFNMHVRPSGVGDAVFIVQDIVIGAVQGTASIIQTTVRCTIQAVRKKDANGNIAGDLYAHAAYRRALNVAAYIDYFTT